MTSNKSDFKIYEDEAHPRKTASISASVGRPAVVDCRSYQDYVTCGISNTKHFSEHCLKTTLPSVGWTVNSEGEITCIGVYKTSHIGTSKNKVKMMTKGFTARERLARIFEARKKKTE